MYMPSLFSRDFDDFAGFPDFSFNREKNHRNGNHDLMKTDVKEFNDHYELEVDLPGFKKDDMKVELNDGYLNIVAETKSENEQNENDGKFIRRERYYGSCQRAFYVGEAVKEDDIKANFKDGVLKLNVPKITEEVKPEKKYIQIFD